MKRPLSARAECYGLTPALGQAGYYETEHNQQLIKDTKEVITQGATERRLPCRGQRQGRHAFIGLKRLMEVVEDVGQHMPAAGLPI